MAHVGLPPYRWFYMADPLWDHASSGHRLLFRTGQAAGLLRGARLAYPAHAPLADPAHVLDAVLAGRARRGGCTVVTTPSAAVRLAALAGERGEDLERVTFLLGGEPLTPGKAEEIRRRGARAGSFYAFSEAGPVGAPCAAPQRPDDTHLLTDTVAMIQHRRAGPGGGPLDAFMFTSLLDSASKIMLNVESDDFGEVATRRCGCLFDDLGLDRHLANIRSFTKLTGEGMTVLGSDVVSILEEMLPREFGGGSIDYQLLELEDDRHLTKLQLIVSPTLGPIDEQAVRHRFLEELRRRPGHSFIWPQADTLQVVRRAPVLTPGGKLFPFYTQAPSGVPETGPSPQRASGSLPDA